MDKLAKYNLRVVGGGANIYIYIFDLELYDDEFYDGIYFLDAIDFEILIFQ